MFIVHIVQLWQWKEADQSAFMDSKLKCVFDYVDDGDAPASNSVGGNVSCMNSFSFVWCGRMHLLLAFGNLTMVVVWIFLDIHITVCGRDRL